MWESVWLEAWASIGLREKANGWADTQNELPGSWNPSKMMWGRSSTGCNASCYVLVRLWLRLSYWSLCKFPSWASSCEIVLPKTANTKNKARNHLFPNRAFGRFGSLLRSSEDGAGASGPAELPEAGGGAGGRRRRRLPAARGLRAFPGCRLPKMGLQQGGPVISVFGGSRD